MRRVPRETCVVQRVKSRDYKHISTAQSLPGAIVSFGFCAVNVEAVSPKKG